MVLLRVTPELGDPQKRSVVRSGDLLGIFIHVARHSLTRGPHGLRVVLHGVLSGRQDSSLWPR
jgi:hypothetical protein